jgi:hypothetical protein
MATEVRYDFSFPKVCDEHFEWGPFMACPFPGCHNGVAEGEIRCSIPQLPEKVLRRCELKIADGASTYVWREDRGGMLLMLSRLLSRETARLGITRVSDASSQTLYHYTSAAGFLGIIGSGEVWLSDYAFLNDATELHHGLELARGVFVEAAEQRPLARSMLERWSKYNLEGHRVCIGSFSHLGDSLSQWRGYGQIAIGFDAKAYPGFGTFRTARWGQVIYDTPTQLRQLELLAHLAASAWEYDLQYDADRVADLYGDGMGHLLNVVGFFKNSGFEDEREIRLVHSEPPDRFGGMGYVPPRSRFRASGELIVPYLSTRDIAENPTELMPITEVLVGPSSAADTIRSGIEQVLQQAGYNDIPVKLSQTPYRR